MLYVYRWMNVRLDFINLLSFATAALLALQGKADLSAAVVGMAIHYALQVGLGYIKGYAV